MEKPDPFAPPGGAHAAEGYRIERDQLRRQLDSVTAELDAAQRRIAALEGELAAMCTTST